MKRTPFLAGALVALGFFTHLQLQAQCGLSLTSTDTVLCNGDSTTITANIPLNTGLTTTMIAGNNHRGNMFDITALSNVTITQFDGHPMGNTTVAVYYKTGSFVGFENNTAAWTLVGTAAVIAQPYGTPTPYPIPVNVTIPAGQTYAFYVTSTNLAVSQNYTDGSGVGNVFASNSFFQFKEGCGLEYPFSGSPFTPRIWNGVIHYDAGNTYTWSNGDTTSTITVAPNTTTTYSVEVNILGCPTTFTDSMSITVHSPVVNLGTDQSVCTNGQVDLDAGAGFTAYSWNTSDTTQTLSIDASTLPLGLNTFSVQVQDTNGCTAADSVNVTIAALPTPNLGADMTLCTDADIVLNPGAGFATYLWSTTDTTATITINAGTLAPGAHTYYVTVTNNDDCVNADTITLNIISCAGIENTTLASQVNMYPNPATEQVYISINTTAVNADHATITLYDDLGKTIITIAGQTSSTGIAIPVSTLTAGIYLVKIQLGEQTVWKKLVKE